jgi:1-phosphofructokinase
MKIATVTLNPAIDQTVRVANFEPGTVNRGQEMRLDAGGKGVNVASFLADYGCPVAVTGFLGEENGEIFERLFARKRIEDHFIRIPGHTRVGMKIVDEGNQRTTDVNLPGLTPPPEALQQLSGTIDRLAVTCDWFVLAGTLPPGVPTNTYAVLIAQLKALGKPVVLDTSGEALRAGMLAGPTILKPNVDELRQLVGHPLEDDAAIERAALELLDVGVRMVAVSMGERGALFVERTTTLYAPTTPVTVKTTVGAGDALVAGLLAGLAQQDDQAAVARLATAFSHGAITRVDGHLPAREQLQEYARLVAVRSVRDESASGVAKGSRKAEGLLLQHNAAE